MPFLGRWKMGNLGYGELLLILAVGLILFGPNKIPEFARQCGRAVNMFKQGLREGFSGEEPKSEEPKKSQRGA
jgi:sec-independent protein translocase protein TatA